MSRFSGVSVVLSTAVQATAKGGRRKALSVAWNGSGTRLVTCGLRHVSFWVFTGRNLSHCRGVFGSKGRRQTLPCCTFIGDTAVVCRVKCMAPCWVRGHEHGLSVVALCLVLSCRVAWGALTTKSCRTKVSSTGRESEQVQSRRQPASSKRSAPPTNTNWNQCQEKIAKP